MNLAQINELRESIGLSPITISGASCIIERERKRAQAANRAKRAQECRDIKARRASRSK